jgi:hypothetical protein
MEGYRLDKRFPSQNLENAMSNWFGKDLIKKDEKKEKDAWDEVRTDIIEGNTLTPSQ